MGGDGVDVVYKSDGSVMIGIDQWPDSSPARSSAGKITTDPNAAANNWWFFAETYDSALANGNVKFYFGTSGSPAALDVARDYLRGAVGTNISRFCIGHFNISCRNTGQNRMFRGLINNVQVFGRALPLENIQGVQVGVPPPPPDIRLTAVDSQWLLLSWIGINLSLQAAPELSGPWIACTNQAPAQFLQPLEARQFFRLR